MLIEDLIGGRSTDSPQILHTIRSSCSQFIHESAGYPLYRSLPRSYNTFHKVKVRAKKRSTAVNEAFNRAFDDSYINLAQRAIFAQPSIGEATDAVEPFYVFPINGFRFLYSKEIQNSTSEYKQVIDTLFEEFGSESQASEIVSDLLKFTYITNNLAEGIASNAELVMYGVPYYYAIRVSAYSRYDHLIARITQ